MRSGVMWQAPVVGYEPEVVRAKAENGSQLVVINTVEELGTNAARMPPISARHATAHERRQEQSDSD